MYVVEEKNINTAYLEVLKLARNGIQIEDPYRKGVTRYKSRRPISLNWNFKNGFPLIGVKKFPWKTAIKEFLWMLTGSTSITDAWEAGLSIWDEDWASHVLSQVSDTVSRQRLLDLGIAYRRSRDWVPLNNFLKQLTKHEGTDTLGLLNLGPIYGKGFRKFGSQPLGTEGDQIKNVVEALFINPQSSDLLVSLWDASVLYKMALPPCHWSHQWVMSDIKSYDNKRPSDVTMDLIVNLRSSDLFLGLPFNITQYAWFADLVINQFGRLVYKSAVKTYNYHLGRITFNLAHPHLYDNSIQRVDELLALKGDDIPETPYSVNWGYASNTLLTRPIEDKYVGYEFSTAITSLWNSVIGVTPINGIESWDLGKVRPNNYHPLKDPSGVKMLPRSQ